ncbi:MAG: endonuclease/exonuclease/phosphatase family protein [Candidatus Levyibacteriota bacterium]|nr:MAG: endonuclease/exonuclease/phosphatase family protein [Candidatus Levybacteria bacterium]
MKILSWNVWSENVSITKAIRFLKKQKADIICLQEVSKKFLQKLKKLPKYQLVCAIDFYYIKSKKRKTPYFLVMLSKISIDTHKAFQIPTVQYDSIIAQIFGLEECIEGQYIDVMYKDQKIRIFNVHFQSYVRPKIRLRQFESVIQQFNNTTHNIVCGDFNTFGFWHFNVVVGWIYNYSWEEFFMDEKTLLDERLKRYKLINIFNWEVTYPWLGVQLDFILTQKNAKVRGKQVFQETFGSDHRPILANVHIT